MMEREHVVVGNLPVFDVGSLRSRATATAEEAKRWDEAMRWHGFARLTNHGLDLLYDQLYGQVKAFFEKPDVDKRQYFLGADHASFEGYTPPKGMSQTASAGGEQSAVGMRPADAVESLESYNSTFETWPPNLRQHATDLWTELEQLRAEIVKLSAAALHLDAEYLEAVYNGDLTVDCQATEHCRNQLMRCFRAARYLPIESVSKHRGQLRYGEHTDYSGLAFLWRSKSNGLQCRPSDSDTHDSGAWLDVPVISSDCHGLVVNLGDLWEMWTNGRWKSNVHRVIELAESDGCGYDASDAQPISVVFFTGPRQSSEVRPLRGIMGPDESQIFPTITAGEHVGSKVRKLLEAKKSAFAEASKQHAGQDLPSW
eukprot:TRINITY_DN11918_c1_g1_i1.p1 TRINITY_DN11918_c1_g1~~TRINITY_DN11918_c1_g1_i1.p1  ORF type:complete len:370 (-),score=31.38 TRINITY_DN11918_c1_g1_i1:50-1159(-)